MAAFDRLPRVLRSALNNATFLYDPIGILQSYSGGVPIEAILREIAQVEVSRTKQFEARHGDPNWVEPGGRYIARF